MNRPRSGFWVTALLDVFLANVGIYLAFYIRFGGEIPPANIQPFIRLVPFISIVLLLLFWSFGLYTSRVRRYSDIVYTIAISIVILDLVTVAMAFFTGGFSFPRTVFIISCLFQWLLLSAWRCVLQYALDSRHGFKKVAVIWPKDRGNVFDEELRFLIGRNYSITYCPEGDEQEKIYSAIISSDIICLHSEVDLETKKEIVALCVELDKHLLLVPNVYEIMLHNAGMDYVGDVPVLKLEPLRIKPAYQLFKRIFDVVVSLVGMVIFSPVFLIIALFIKADTPGPVFYKQTRVGLGGSEFKLIKFRTMITDAEKETGPVLATEDDPRITKVGRFLRKTRLDEIPQLANVLKGEMSLVGPRPERPFFVEQYGQEIPEYLHRLKVKPGITGLAQVLGKYDTTPEDKLIYDLYYIKNYNPLLDIQIILRTLKIPFEPDAAKGFAKESNVAAAVRLPDKTRRIES